MKLFGFRKPNIKTIPAIMIWKLGAVMDGIVAMLSLCFVRSNFSCYANRLAFWYIRKVNKG